MVEMDSKVWFLAAGQKKVGPLAASRLLERVAQGKVPAEARVWREGMDDWRPLHEVADFQSSPTIATAVEEPRKRSGSGVRKAPRKVAARATAPTVAPFEPPHRIDRGDLWRAFGLGLDARRVTIVLTTVVLAMAVGGLLLGLGHVAAKLHALLALPFLLASALGLFAVACLGLGALSHHTRRRIEDGAPPTVSQAFGFAARHAPSLTLPPLLLSVAWLVPLVALVVLSVAVKVPYLGPVGTGALFGVHIALSALTLYLLLTAGVASAFGPIVVGFEGAGVGATLRALLAFARASTVRVFLWGLKPALAMVPFAALVLLVTALVLALPLGSVGVMVGGEALAWLVGGEGDAPLPGLGLGALPLALWVGLTLSAAVAVLGSVQNALLSLLYVAGRPGNDERPSRDAWLAARAVRSAEAN